MVIKKLKNSLYFKQCFIMKIIRKFSTGSLRIFDMPRKMQQILPVKCLKNAATFIYQNKRSILVELYLIFSKSNQIELKKMNNANPSDKRNAS